MDNDLCVTYERIPGCLILQKITQIFVSYHKRMVQNELTSLRIFIHINNGKVENKSAPNRDLHHPRYITGKTFING